MRSVGRDCRGRSVAPDCGGSSVASADTRHRLQISHLTVNSVHSKCMLTVPSTATPLRASKIRNLTPKKPLYLYYYILDMFNIIIVIPAVV